MSSRVLYCIETVAGLSEAVIDNLPRFKLPAGPLAELLFFLKSSIFASVMRLTLDPVLSVIFKVAVVTSVSAGRVNESDK